MKMKKLVSLFLTLAMICGMIPAMSFGTTTAQEVAPRAATPTLTSEYKTSEWFELGELTGTNVFRNGGYVVKYTSSFDFKTDCSNEYGWYESYRNIYAKGGKGYTCTNQWGVDLVINKNGYVVDKIPGGNAKIPSDGGYVLSVVNRDSDKQKGDFYDTVGTFVKENIQIGDFIKEKDGVFSACRVTEDSKFTHASKSLEIFKTDVLEIVEAGKTPTKATQWTSVVLIKSTGKGEDGIANHTGYLVDFGGKELTVPSGHIGLVISGSPLDGDNNGAPSYNAAQAFKELVAPGSIVNIGADVIHFRYDVAAAKRAAALMTGSTTVNSTVTKNYDYSAATIYNDATSKFELVDTAKMKTLYENMQAIASAVQSMTTIDQMQPYMATLYQNYRELQALEMENKSVEMRAVWWRPLENDRVQRTKAQLDAMVDEHAARFANQGYNMVFIECFYNSCTMFPTDESAGYDGLYFKQNPYLVPKEDGGLNVNLTEPYDMLQSWIDACEKYGMECHAWWQVLYIGYQRHNVSNSDDLHEYGIGPIIEADIRANKKDSKYYNWLNLGHDGSYVSGSADKLTRYWLNPGNKGVRQLLLNTLSYVCKNYEAVGSFQLDYFRHPNDGIREFGYDSDTIAAFKAAYPSYANVDLTKSSYHKDANWVQFRADYITSLIGEMRAMLDKEFPTVSLTTSPQPDPAAALRSDLQDVSAWLGNGYIDTIFPMAYGYHVPGYVTPTLVQQNAKRFVCTGLSIEYNNETLEMDWVRQIRHAGADGVATFGDTIPEYVKTIWSNKAVTPTGDPTNAAKVYLSETVTKRAAKMKELGSITNAQYTALLEKINAALTAVTNYSVNSAEAVAALNALETFGNTLGTNPKTAIANDVAYLTKIRTNGRLFDIQEGQTVVSGTIEDKIPLSFDGVDYVELNNLTMTADKSYAWYSTEKAPTVQIELTGKNTFTYGASKFMNFDDKNISYCGTGSVYQGSKLFLQMGDVNDDKALNTTDIRNLLRYNVKLDEFSDEQLAISDANGDGIINTIDTRIFLDACTGL